ncbi:hypothetical protein NQX30_04575 [Candidatus Persebacteraceae bacterium Df01]|jgi:hypothetical protein|uniref:Uncharacterized protein n=1 Tax=Candidatus Doriopsillibacter californiensis TaxID=2970740 RepID=A0ABT7QLS0_9GAMM|nr:hypothetical protein [Candidatus Persebacteraceae bacterium Df01]
MNTFEFFIRLALSVIVLFFMVLGWALVPYINDEPINTGFISVFFGAESVSGFTRNVLLLSRGCLGLTVLSWIFVPSWQFFYDTDFSPLARAFVIIFSSLTVIAFFGALLYHISFSR